MILKKMSAIALVEHSEKEVKREFLDNAKEMFGSDTKSLLIALNSAPKGEELEKQADEWRQSFSGMISTLAFSVKKLNPDASDNDVKEYVESLDAEALAEAIKLIWGAEEVDDAKKK